MSEVFGAVLKLQSNVQAVFQQSIKSSSGFRSEVDKAKKSLKEYEAQKVKEKELRVKNSGAYKAIEGVKRKLEPISKKAVEIKAKTELAQEKIKTVKKRLDSIKENKVIQFAAKGAEGVTKALGKAALVTSAVAFTAVAAAGTAAVTQAVSFQAEMKNVGTLLDGDVNAKLESMGTSLKKVSIDTGVATTELTDGLYQTISAFGESSESVKQLEIAAKSAKAGGATTTDAINLLSAVTKGYGDTSAKAMQQVSDMAFQTVKLGQTTFPELASSMGGVVAMSSQMGVSQEELFGSLATLTGVTGGTAEVCTQLEGVMSSFMSPSAEMSKALKKLGYESGAAALEAEGMQGILDKLSDSVGGNSIDLANLFGEKSAKQAVLALSGDLASTWQEKTAAMANASGAATAAFDTQQESVQAMAGKIKNAGQVMLTSLGEKALPYITSALEKVIDKLPMMEAAFDTVAANVGPAIEMIASGLGPIISSWQPVIDQVGQMFAGAFGEGGIIASAAAFLGPIIYGINSVATEVFPVIAQIAQELGNKFAGAFSFMSSKAGFLQELLATAGPAISSVLQTVWKVVGPILDVGISVVKLFAAAFEKAFPAIQSVVSTVWSVLEPIFDAIGTGIGWLASGVEKVVGFISGDTGSNSSGANVDANATGTDYFRGGWTTVGEHGPELMRLPGGTQIKSNSDSLNMLGGGKKYEFTIQHMEVRSDADIDKIAEAFVKKIEEADDNM